MARLLGIDYGKKRIGIAVTDPLQLIATPLQTVRSAGIFDFLKRYLQKEQVEAMVVGKPLCLNGDVSERMALVNDFVGKAKKHLPHLAIFTFDERFTSSMAQASRLEGNFKKKARQDKKVLDQISATLILRDFLSTWQYHRKATKPV